MKLLKISLLISLFSLLAFSCSNDEEDDPQPTTPTTTDTTGTGGNNSSDTTNTDNTDNTGNSDNTDNSGGSGNTDNTDDNTSDTTDTGNNQDDNTPTEPSPTNNAPSIAGQINLHSGVTTADLTPYMTDADGDAVSLVSIEGATNGEFVINGNVVTYEPYHSIYAGTETITVTVTDGTTTSSSVVNVKVGNNAQELTYNKMASFIGLTLDGSVSNLVLSADGTATSNQSVDFYGIYSVRGTFAINSSGNLVVTVGGQEMTEFEVATVDVRLAFRNVSTGQVLNVQPI